MSELNGTIHINRISEVVGTGATAPKTSRKPRSRAKAPTEPAVEIVAPAAPTVARRLRDRLVRAAGSLVDADSATLSAVGVVALGATLSGTLNGYHYSEHSPSAVAGWGLGLAVPALILGLARIAGGAYAARRRLPAVVAGLSGLGLLALSVGHCAASIAAVTGSGLALALPLAIAIDCGLVAGELYLATGHSTTE